MKKSGLCRFPNLRSTTFCSMTWEEFHGELTSDKHKRVTEAYRATLRELSALETSDSPDKALLDSYKRLKGEYKLNQPAVVAMCTLEGGRTNAHVTGYTGVVMVDIDDLSDDEFPDILERVKADKYSMSAHTTLSGLGIRVFCRMAGEVSAGNFNACWQAVNSHYARLAGVEVDEKCKNPTRMSVICHDKDALFRPDADAFPMPEVKAKKEKGKKVGRPAGRRTHYTPAEVEKSVRGILEKEGVHYEAGNHNNYIHRALSLMNRFGVGELDATEWALRTFADSDAPDNNVVAIASSCYKRTAEHGTMTLRESARMLRGRRSHRLSGEQQEEMAEFLHEYCRLRHNTLINQQEILMLKNTREEWLNTGCRDLMEAFDDADREAKREREKRRRQEEMTQEPPMSEDMRKILEEEQGESLVEGESTFREEEWDDGWRRVTDRIENSLWCAMVRKGISVELSHLRNLLQSDFVPEHHPMQEYLDSLPAWDGKTDHIGRFADMVHCTCCDQKTFRAYFRRWFVGMVASAVNKKVVNHVIFVLIGPQGAYKSSFMERILPPPLQRYYNLKTNSRSLTKDDAFTITENYLVNFEEIDTMSRTELNQLKALTTSTFINERPAYAHNKILLPHVASFCATGNKTEFLTDDTGNRRWLPFEVERIDNPWTTPIDYEGIYAQAKSLLKRNYRYYFNPKDVEALNRRNRRFEEENTARNLLLAYYRRPAEGERAKYLNTAQIMLRFGGAVRLNKSQLIAALKELGFEQSRTRSGRFWAVVERSAEEIEQILPEPVEPARSTGAESLPHDGPEQTGAPALTDGDALADSSMTPLFPDSLLQLD